MAVSAEEKIRQTIDSYDQTVLAYFKNTKDLHPIVAAKEFYSKLSAEPHILDHGCGPGRDSKIFSDLFRCSVTGIDLSKGMIEFARNYAPRAAFAVADMRHLPFKENTFDGIWSVASLLNIPKSEADPAIHEACRTLKPSGVLYLRIKRGDGERIEMDSRYTPPVPKVVSYYSPAEIAWLLERNGFYIEGLECKAPIGEYQKSTELNIFSRKM